MKKERLIHTPEGVRDLYNSECARKKELKNRMRKVMAGFGYQDIETPSYEYFDIFNNDKGSLSSSQMFKFFDREGNTLVLRPDITPSIARAVSKYFADEPMAMRFSYNGSVFINNSRLQGRLSEYTQMGAEFIGDDSIEADAEMIVMAVSMLRACGLTDFQIDIGHVGFFNGLIEEAGMDEEKTDTIRDLIENKNDFAVRKLTDNLALIQLPKLFGSKDILTEAKRLTSNMQALSAITRLERLYDIIDAYGLSDYVSFDLGMLTEYEYYTGMIFRGYTYGTGDAVVAGGRYDALLKTYGKDAPAIGFAVYVDDLLTAMTRQKNCPEPENKRAMLLYHSYQMITAIQKIGELRTSGEEVSLTRINEKMALDDYMAYAKRFNIRTIYYFTTDGDFRMVEVMA